jgi:hypothetical protein
MDIVKGIARKVAINTLIVTLLGCGVAISEMSEPTVAEPPAATWNSSTGQIVVDG